MINTEQRGQVVSEALSWVGTPYKGWSCLKRHGVDCGQFLKGVYGHCTGADIPLPKGYSLQMAQHREDTEYIDIVKTYMREIPEDEAGAGDVVLYKLGRAFAHAGIIVAWPGEVIHAEAHHGVTRAHGTNNPLLRRASARKFFTLKDNFTVTK